MSTCNAEVALRFLGAWLPVLRELMSVYSIKKAVKVEFLLSKILTNTCVADSKSPSIDSCSEVAIIEDIFGIKGLSRDVD